MDGPTLYTAGPTIYSANTAREGDSLVEAYHSAGYDCIKIYNDVSVEGYDAIIRTAKKYDMITVGHIPRAPGYEGVLKAHQAIAHAEEYMYTVLKDSVDERRIPELVQSTRSAGITVIATLISYEHITKQIENLDSMLALPGIDRTPEWIRNNWAPGQTRYSTKRGFKIPRMEYRLQFQKKLVAALHKAGVPVLVGTDAVFNAMVTGKSALQEVERFVEIGFTPYEALRAATHDAAVFLHSDAEFGTLETGKRADMVLCDGNPLVDIHAIERQTGVMTRGRWYTTAELHHRLDSLPSVFSAELNEFRNDLKTHLPAAIQYENHRDPFNLLLSRELMAMAEHHQSDNLVSLLRGIRTISPGTGAVQEQTINDFGYELMKMTGLMKEAIAVLTLNTELYGTANSFDSLGEGYFNDGNMAMSKQCYQRALALDPNMESSKLMLQKIK
jgi:hypothetical protein